MKRELEALLIQCVAAVFCLMYITACVTGYKKPRIDSTEIKLRDSLNRAAQEADKKASLERFWNSRKHRP